MIDTDPLPVAPTITGTHETDTLLNVPVNPFSGVTISDANANATDTLTITLNGVSGTLSGTGLIGGNSLFGTATVITSELDALTFTPTSVSGHMPGWQSATSFQLTDVSNPSGLSASNNLTTVIESVPAVAPTITGTIGSQQTVGETPIKPFAHVTLGDANGYPTDTLTISLSDAGLGGTLTGAGLSGGNNGVYTVVALTPAATTSELDALTFTPAIADTTIFTLTDVNVYSGTSAKDSTTTVTDTKSTTPPTITGTHTASTTNDTPVNPFTGVTVIDPNVGASDTLDITFGDGYDGGVLSGTGLQGDGKGGYLLAGTAAAITSELDALMFTPTYYPPPSVSGTYFDLSDQSSAYATPVVDSTTFVSDTNPGVPPTVTGTHTTQTTNDTPVKPFSGVTFTDPTVGATDTLFIVLDGSGTLTGTGLYPNNPLTGVDGEWDVVTGTSAQITSELDALVFTPATGAPGSTTTTTFALTATSNKAMSATYDYATKVIDTDPPPVTNLPSVYWYNSADGTLSNWTMNGSVIANSGRLTSNGNIVAPPSSWSVANVGDFNGDGQTDILWRNTNGTVAEWTMNGSVISSSGLITSQGNVVNFGVGSPWSVVGTGDFNDGGKAEILWRNSATNTVAEWSLNGSAIANSGPVTLNGNAVAPPSSWSVAGTGDFNGDQKADILWGNTNGTLAVWTMNGSAIASSGLVTSNGITVNFGVGSTWNVMGVGDFNGDGTSDILWHNATTGAVVDWSMNGSNILNSQHVTYQGNQVALDNSWSVASIGKFNGNNDADILWRNTSGALSEWQMDGSNIVSAQHITSNGNTVNLGAGSPWHALPGQSNFS